MLLHCFQAFLVWTTSYCLVQCLTLTLPSPPCDQDCCPGRPVCLRPEGPQILWPSDRILGPSLLGHHCCSCHIYLPLLVGDLSAADSGKLQAVLERASRWGLCAHNPLSLLDLCDRADRALFGAIATNPHHVFSPLLPSLRFQTYNVRRRPHSFVIRSWINSPS